MAGDKPTSYFLGMEKRNRKTLDVLIKDNGEKLTFLRKFLGKKIGSFKVLYTTRASTSTELFRLMQDSQT